MIYKGLNPQEYAELIVWLEAHGVPHETVRTHIDSVVPLRRGRLTESEVEIVDDVLRAIDPKHYPALSRWHIYPQHLEAPVELRNLGELPPELPELIPRPRWRGDGESPAGWGTRLVLLVWVLLIAYVVWLEGGLPLRLFR
jgi:hypothetical protein